MLTIKKRVMKIKIGQGYKEVYMRKILSWAVLLRASQLKMMSLDMWQFSPHPAQQLLGKLLDFLKVDILL